MRFIIPFGKFFWKQALRRKCTYILKMRVFKMRFIVSSGHNLIESCDYAFYIDVFT